MAFWNSETVLDRGQREALVTPFQQTRVKHGAYELSLGPEAFVTDSPDGKKQTLKPGEQLVIRPGQFGLLLTEETICMPSDALGFISIKAGIKFAGLVNVSGFHVDPRFKGRLKFAVYNAGSQNVVLTRGEPVFPIWFNVMEPTSDHYNGTHNNQQGISSQDVMRLQGQVSSPAALKLEIEELRTQLTTTQHSLEIQVNTIQQTLAESRAYSSQLRIAVIAAIIGAIVGGLFVLALQRLIDVMPKELSSVSTQGPPVTEEPSSFPESDAHSEVPKKP